MFNIRKLLGDTSPSPWLWESEALLEELLQLLLLQLHHQVVEDGVEEAGLVLAGNLVLSLAEVCLGIKEVSVRTLEYSVSRENSWPNLPAHIELLAAGHLLIVAWLPARVDGGGGDTVQRL